MNLRTVTPILATLTGVFTLALAFANEQRPVVAIYEVHLATPTTELHFGTGEGVRDVLAALLKSHQIVDVVDWAGMKSALAQRKLERSGLTATPSGSGEAPGILSSDYFMVATVTYTQELRNERRALSSSKLLIGDIEVGLTLKHAYTNEVVASATGAAVKERKSTRRVGFGGASPGTVSGLSREVLREALDKAVNEIVNQAFGE